MFKKISRIRKFLELKKENDLHNKNQYKKAVQQIPCSIKEIKKMLNGIFNDCNDFRLRELTLNNSVNVIIAYIDGLVSNQIINDNIIMPILKTNTVKQSDIKENSIDLLCKKIINTSSLSKQNDMDNVINKILSGNAAIFIDGKSVALTAGVEKWEKRAVEEPSSEKALRGPREGFVETLKTNTSMIRRKIKNTNLKFEYMTLGEVTNTEICLCYIKGIANENILSTLKRRLNKIKIDSILESGYIEEFIEDAPFSIFPSVGNAEKPDKVAAKLLEGHIAVLCDGTPYVLTVPYTFIESFQASDDYYMRSFYASFVRFLRFLAFLISSTAPAVYVALISFHQGTIPFNLLVTIVSSREGIPFSPFAEALFMMIAFELLREAGIRMPKTIGQTVSIVGAIVLGDASVKAGLVSSLMVIVIAVTAITTFMIPPFEGTLPFIRLLLLIAANIQGFLGIGITITFITVHLCTIRSFDVPYMAPFTPLYGMDLKDTFIRVPIWRMFSKPRFMKTDNAYKVQYRMKRFSREKED